MAPAAVNRDTIFVVTEDRIVFPASVRARLNWLGEVGSAILAVLEPDHRSELLPWAPCGEAVIADVERPLRRQIQFGWGTLILR
jgi:hypothetical protein